jgi:uncharacterized protein YndB with AHSA1/START domain
MRARTIDVIAHSDAPRDIVFALLVDGSTWPNWAPLDSFQLERAGHPPPEGPGAIRVFTRGRTTGRDEIVSIVPGHRLEYVSLSGLPVRDYRGVVVLDDAHPGTTIHWQSHFFPRVVGTGWLLERGLRRFLSGCADGLAAYAARARHQSIGRDGPSAR